MQICNGCGGVLGRDCFNPRECEQISQQQQYEQFPPQEPSKVFEIDFEGHVLAKLKFENGKLEVLGAMNGYGNT